MKAIGKNLSFKIQKNVLVQNTTINNQVLLTYIHAKRLIGTHLNLLKTACILNVLLKKLLIAGTMGKMYSNMFSIKDSDYKSKTRVLRLARQAKGTFCVLYSTQIQHLHMLYSTTQQEKTEKYRFVFPFIIIFVLLLLFKYRLSTHKYANDQNLFLWQRNICYEATGILGALLPDSGQLT